MNNIQEDNSIICLCSRDPKQNKVVTSKTKSKKNIQTNQRNAKGNMTVDRKVYIKKSKIQG